MARMLPALLAALIPGLTGVVGRGCVIRIHYWKASRLINVWQGALGGSGLMLLFKWFNFVLCLASLATAGLGE